MNGNMFVNVNERTINLNQISIYRRIYEFLKSYHIENKFEIILYKN